MDISMIVLKLSEGMVTSIEIFLLTLVFSLSGGLIVALGRISEIKMIRYFTKGYISIMRGTPLMLQLMVVYFGPYYVLGRAMPRGFRFWAVIIGFVLNYSAYFGEIYRSGIESMEKGQYEAAEVLGYTSMQTFLYIILPQVFKRVLPSVTNEVITLVKDTSLAFVISVSELFTAAKALASAEASMIPYVAAGVFYYVFNFGVAFVMEKIEGKMNYYN